MSVFFIFFTVLFLTLSIHTFGVQCVCMLLSKFGSGKLGITCHLGGSIEGQKYAALSLKFFYFEHMPSLVLIPEKLEN